MRVNRKTKDLVPDIPMGPMIDIVFLLLIFFLVTAKPIKPEADIGLSLPGTVTQDESIQMPDEQQVEIRRDGQVVMNDRKLDSPDSQDLPELVTLLKRFRETSLANKTEPLVTIKADDSSLHQRLVDVLNACAEAKIRGVTFATGGDNQGEEIF